jgi:hypothetical protein
MVRKGGVAGEGPAPGASPDFPGQRLIVCRNPDLAAQRISKREDLLAATERALARVRSAALHDLSVASKKAVGSRSLSSSGPLGRPGGRP